MKKLLALSLFSILILSGCSLLECPQTETTTPEESTALTQENIENTPTEETSETTENSPETNTTEAHIYEDDSIKFEYPENLEILVEAFPAGRTDSRTITFIYPDEESSSYYSTYLTLNFMRKMSENDKDPFANYEDLKNHYSEYNLPITTYNVDGREAILVETGGMMPDAFFMIIPAEGEYEGEAYRFNGYLDHTETQEALEMFVNTAVLKK